MPFSPSSSELNQKKSSHKETRILAVSALLALAFALGGLILGIMADSLVILFDGFYSLVSLLLTLLSLSVSRYFLTNPDAKPKLEPLVIALKGAVILLVVAVSLHSAVIALFTGGREIDISIASLFGVVNVLGCGFTWWYIVKQSGNRTSPLIEAEAKQWKMDTLLSVAVTLGFVIALTVSFTPFDYLAVYADPLMMCLISAYFIKVPLDMVTESVSELIQVTKIERSLVNRRYILK